MPSIPQIVDSIVLLTPHNGELFTTVGAMTVLGSHLPQICDDETGVHCAERTSQGGINS